ncbi:hypothetical protein, partial [Pseudohongiella sp. O18]|uniref:hypothetical protein n=1 Tax=Pseudohongiella sp. O18 TaxID=2904248 RepID=UPI001F216E5C
MMLREFLILILILAIIVVLLRGIYVAMRRRKNKIKFQLEKNIPEYDLEELELRELPSGGARVVERSFAEVMRQHGLPNDRIPAARGPGSLSSPTKTFPKKTTDTFARAKGHLKEGQLKNTTAAAAGVAASTVASQESTSPLVEEEGSWQPTEPYSLEPELAVEPQAEEPAAEQSQDHQTAEAAEQVADSNVGPEEEPVHEPIEEATDLAAADADTDTDQEWGAAVDRASAHSYDDDNDDWLDDVSPVREVKVAADRRSDETASRTEPTFDASASGDWDTEFAETDADSTDDELVEDEAVDAESELQYEPEPEIQPEAEPEQSYQDMQESETGFDTVMEPVTEEDPEDSEDADSDTEFEFSSATSFGAQRGADDEVNMDEQVADDSSDSWDGQGWQDSDLEELESDLHESELDELDPEESGLDEPDWSESNLYETDEDDEAEVNGAGDAEEWHAADEEPPAEQPRRRAEPEELDDVLDELLEQSGVSVHAAVE